MLNEYSTTKKRSYNHFTDPFYKNSLQTLTNGFSLSYLLLSVISQRSYVSTLSYSLTGKRDITSVELVQNVTEYKQTLSSTFECNEQSESGSRKEKIKEYGGKKKKTLYKILNFLFVQ